MLNPELIYSKHRSAISITLRDKSSGSEEEIRKKKGYIFLKRGEGGGRGGVVILYTPPPLIDTLLLFYRQFILKINGEKNAVIINLICMQKYKF